MIELEASPGSVDRECQALTSSQVTQPNTGHLVTSGKAPVQHGPSTLAGDAAVSKAEAVGFLHSSQISLPEKHRPPARMSE